jgi:cell wall-associated NlpC family hydrolase
VRRDELPAWVDAYRGRPFVKDGEGPEAFDCYGLVRAVLRERFGVQAPAMDGLSRALEDPGSPWVQVGDEEPPCAGDVLVFLGLGRIHVAVVVARNWVLHAMDDVGVCTGRFDRGRLALHRFGPAWRHRDLVTGAAA